MAELRDRVTDYLGWAVPTSDGHKLVKDLWVELSTRTAPAKGEVSRKLGNDTCDTHLRPVKGCKACTPKGTCPECGELETWENHLNGFQLGGYRCWPCHDKHEKSSKPAPTPEPAKHTEDCDRVKGFSRNRSCAPTPGDRVREKQTIWNIGVAKNHLVGALGFHVFGEDGRKLVSARCLDRVKEAVNCLEAALAAEEGK